jgi:hypothetical protein
MALSSSQGFRCPQCNARHVWVVDDCDACGYRSEASRGWEREGKRQARREWLSGWHWWCLGDMLEGFFWIGRMIFGAIRAVVSTWH